MVEGKAWERKRIMFVFVAVLAICAIVAITVVLVLNREKFFGQDGAKRTFPESMHTKEFEEINELAAEMTVEDAVGLYEAAIAEADTELAVSEARVEYGRYLLNNGEMSSFVEQFEQVDDAILGPGYKILYYAALRDYYGLVDAEEISDEYNEKIREVTEESDYAAGG